MNLIASHVTKRNLIHFAEDSFSDLTELDVNTRAIEFMLDELKIHQREPFLVAFSSTFLQVSDQLSNTDDYDDLWLEAIDLVEDVLLTLDEDHEEKEIEWVVNFAILLYDYLIEQAGVDELLEYKLYEISVNYDRYTLVFGDEYVNDPNLGILKARY